jgi:TonB family protein
VYADLGPDNGGFPINVSEDGLAFQGIQPLERDQVVPIKFKLPGIQTFVSATGQIAWVNETRKGGGLRFIELHDEDRRVLTGWLSLHIKNAQAAAPAPKVAPVPPRVAAVPTKPALEPLAPAPTTPRKPDPAKEVRATPIPQEKSAIADAIVATPKKPEIPVAAVCLETKQDIDRSKLPAANAENVIAEEPAVVTATAETPSMAAPQPISEPSVRVERIISSEPQSEAATIPASEEATAIISVSSIVATENVPASAYAQIVFSAPELTSETFIPPKTKLVAPNEVSTAISAEAIPEPVQSSAHASLAAPAAKAEVSVPVAKSESSEISEAPRPSVPDAASAAESVPAFPAADVVTPAAKLKAEPVPSISKSPIVPAPILVTTFLPVSSETLRVPASSTYVASKTRKHAGRRATPWLIASLGFAAAISAAVWHFEGDSLSDLVGISATQPENSFQSPPLPSPIPSSTLPVMPSPASEASRPAQSELSLAVPDNKPAKSIVPPDKRSRRQSLRRMAASKPVAPKRSATPQSELLPPVISGTLVPELTPRLGNSSLPPAPVVLPTLTYEPTGRSATASGSAEIAAAQLINQRRPSYPPAARAAGVTGSVELHFTIAPDGRVQNIRVVKGNDLLANAAVEAVKQWRYRPAQRDGITFATEANFMFVFK